MDIESAATLLEALGNPTRLAIFQYLAKSDANGCTVGEIRDQLDIPASTLSHHIAKLVRSELIGQERDSRKLVCHVNNASMDSLMEFLVLNCCTEDWYIQSD